MSLTISSQESLLAETNPASIDELFNRDPLLLQQQDLAKMVAYFRQKREQWIVEEKEGKVKPTKQKTPKRVATLDDLKDFSL